MRPLISSRDCRHGVPAISSRADRYEAGCRDQAPVARFRPEVDYLELLINENGRPYRNWGVDAMMDRLQESVGFRIHAHGFRHTFATVATQLGWNFERLRLAMGHEDYMTLHRYVRLAMDRDLGRLEDWTEFIAVPPQIAFRELRR
jgi:integrase